MDIIIQQLEPVSRFLDKIQRILSLEPLAERYPQQFEKSTCVGRVGLMGCVLGMIWGIHAMAGLWCSVSLLSMSNNISVSSEGDTTTITSTITTKRVAMAWAWCFYITSLCTFHLLEFFITALYNPTVASSDSYLVNHSKAYTAAFLSASIEFWIRFWFFPTLPITVVTRWGVFLVVISQCIRSAAMRTCGESFNHYIQTSKKDNHVLVKDGIYKILRHPSYVGFFYFAIASQWVLRNPICMVLFTVAGWSFFSRRIPYEERSLIHHFGKKYYEYASQTYVGIPFISNGGLIPEQEEEDENEEETNPLEVVGDSEEYLHSIDKVLEMRKPPHNVDNCDNASKKTI